MNIDEAFARALRQQKAGLLPEAEDGYQRILAIDREQAEVHYNLGLVPRERGRLQDAANAAGLPDHMARLVH